MTTSDRDAWTVRSRVVLTPVAAPAVLGWFALCLGVSQILAGPVSAVIEPANQPPDTHPQGGAR
jgi:hypothetical protein